MRPGSRIMIALTSACVVVAAACHDAPTTPRLQSPLVGTWELSTHFDTLSSEMGYSPPSCMTTYCPTYSTQVAGAYLGGVLQVQDSIGLHGEVATSVQASGTLTQTFLGTDATLSYAGDITGTPDSTTPNSLTVTLYVPDSTTVLLRMMQSIGATYAGDSIYGRLRWGYNGGRYPPTYHGSFVMRRVK